MSDYVLVLGKFRGSLYIDMGQVDVSSGEGKTVSILIQMPQDNSGPPSGTVEVPEKFVHGLGTFHVVGLPSPLILKKGEEKIVRVKWNPKVFLISCRIGVYVTVANILAIRLQDGTVRPYRL